MDLSSYATKKNADEGKWFPVKLDGVKVPLALLLYGSDSDIVQNYEKQRVRKLGVMASNKKEVDEDTVGELLDSKDEGLIIRVGAVSTYDWKAEKNTDEKIELDGREIGNDKKSIAFLLEHFPALKDFISEKSNKRINFLD